MNIEREILETDILIVGAGPAGLSAAYKLGQLLGANPEVSRPEIFFMDKGSYVEAHSLSGAILDRRGLSELIPDFVEKGAPLESPVTGDSFYFLTANGAMKAPINPPPLNNHGNYVISLNKFTGWLAQQVEALGIDLYAGMAGYDLIIEDGRVAGVQTVDMGLDKDGTPKANFEPGLNHQGESNGSLRRGARLTDASRIREDSRSAQGQGAAVVSYRCQGSLGSPRGADKTRYGYSYARLAAIELRIRWRLDLRNERPDGVGRILRGSGLARPDKRPAYEVPALQDAQGRPQDS